MSYMDHLWTDSDNLAEKLEMFVFYLQEILISENINYELPDDFKYLKFDYNDPAS